MPVNDFEKQVQQKMEELKFAPSAEVWTEVEKHIRKEKKRRRIIFWWLIPGLLLGVAAFYFVNNNGSKTNIAKQEQQVEQKQNGGESNNLNDPTTNDETPGAATSNEITQPNDAVDKSETGDVLTKNDPSSVQKNAAVEINVIKAGVTKKKKKNTDDRKTAEPSIEITVEELVLVVTKKKQFVIDTTEAVAINNDQLTQEENKVEEKKDSAASITDEVKKELEEPKAIEEEKNVSAKGKSKKKWDLGFGVQAGSSNTVVGRLFGGMMERFDATPLQNSTGSGTYNGPPVYLSSPTKRLSFGFDVFAQKSISKKLDFRISGQYNYLSTQVKTGSRVDSSRQVNNSISDALTINNFYRPPSGAADKSYTNRYHFAGLSAVLSWKIVNGKKFNLRWDNGLSVNQLLSTNALHYDRNLMAYYTDFEPYRKTQWFISTGLSIPLLSKDKFRITLNPFAQYGLRSVLKKGSDPNSYFTNYGIGVKFLFPAKK